MAPRSVARGVPRSGDRAAEGMPGRAKIYIWRQQPATGSHLPLEDTASPCAVCPILTQPGWDGALRAVCLVRLLAKGSTIRVGAFRASHPEKPPSRQRRFIRRFPSMTM